MDKSKSKKISTTKRSERIIEDLEQASQAQAEYEYAKAIELYSQVLADEEITPEAAYEALDQRAECYNRVGQIKDELDDLDKMVAIAQELGSPEMQMAIVYRQVYSAARMGENEKLKEIADRAAILAQDSDGLSIKAGAALARGYFYYVVERYPEAQNEIEQALRLYRADADSDGEANSLITLSSIVSRGGNQNLAGKYALDALEIWRARGERKKEAAALNSWSTTFSDYAQERDAKEEALEIFKSIGDRWGQGHMYNNLSLIYGHMGLYSTAREYAKHAVDIAREVGALLSLAYYLESLARVEMNMGDYETAKKTFEECREISREIESSNLEAFAVFGLGRIALESGDPESARELIQEALDTFRETNLASDFPTALAWLSAAYLGLDDPQSARMYTAEGITELEATGLGGTEYPPQEVWWWYYQALTYEIRQRQTDQEGGSKEVLLPENAWSALQRAREITVEVIQSLSDEGLRRNYFNKVEINREIITEWARQATLRKMELEEMDSQSGNLQAQLQRQLAIGVRMNERREVEALIDFIMDELIELSGAERAMLVLMDDSGKRSVAASYGFIQEDEGGFLKQAENLLKSVETAKMHVLRQDVLQGEIDATSDNPFEALSVLCVPLLAKGKLSGFIYADNHAIFGHFTQADVDLLAAFANQVAAAIENAELYQGLEQKVIERTTELSASNQALEQRNAELAVINSVQEGLAAQMEFEAIIELVGEKIRQVFNAQGISISLYDRANNLVSRPYLVDDDQRITIELTSQPLGFTRHILETSRPLLVNKNLLKKMEELGSQWIRGDERETRQSKSYLGVPIISAREVIGVISLTNYDQEDAFSEADISLLSTLASSMSVALENARLFEETNQRAADLAVINEVQQGLSEQLEFQAIIDLVGDKLMSIFKTQNLSIVIYDAETDLTHWPYFNVSGKKHTIDPTPLGGFSGHVINSGKSLVINKDVEAAAKKFDSYLLGEDTNWPESMAYVPIISEGKSIGAIGVYGERENAYDAASVSLIESLAGSLGIALSNVRLFEETTQRAAELAVINSVQEGLAAELDMQAIYDLVGNTLREVFVGNGVAISIFDHERSLENIAYLFERGERLYPQPETISKAAQYFIESRKPIKYNTIEEILAIGAKIVEGTEAEKSGMWAPLISGETVRGQIAVFSHKEEYAFTDDDVRLITTLASSMSVALENARLFDETNQRAADLAVINEVQQGLSEKLEFQAIIDLVGDKLMSIFKTQNLSIVIYDAETNLSHWPYTNWLGKKRTIDPTPLSGFSGHVIKTGKSIVINKDVEAAAKKFDSFLLDKDTSWPKSIAYVPIISEGKSIGMIGVSDTERENAYDAASVRLIESLASSLGIALSNVSLFEEINQRAAELALVNQVQEGLAAELDMQAIYDLVGDTLREVFKTEGASITIYDLERGLDYCTYLYEEGERIFLEPHKIGEASQAFIKNRKPFKYDTLQEIEKIGGKIQEGTKAEKSGLWAPLLVGETVKGKLSVLNHEREYAYTESDLRLLTTLANSMSVALENARLFDETNQRAAELAVINSVQEGLAAELDMQAIYDLVGEKIRQVFNAQGVAISIYDHERGYINNPYAYELGERLSVDPYPINEPHKKFIQDHKPLMFNSVKEYKDFGAQLVKGTKQDQSGMWVPLMVGETIKGRINVFNLEEEHAFDDADLNLLTTLANSMSVSLENARLFEETNQRAAELALINSVQQGLAAELDMQAIYDLVGDQIRDVFDAQAVIITTYDYLHELTVFNYMFEKGERIFPSPIPISPVNKRLIENRQPLLMETSQDFADYGSTLIDGTEYPNSGIFVPLTIGDSVRGSISLQNFDRERAYGEADVGLLSTLANSMSVALENARLFDETNQRAAELAIINSVQKALASKLDFQSVIDFVGDKLQEVLGTQNIDIRMIDKESNLVHYLYMYEHGERFEFPSAPIAGLSKFMSETMEPLVINENLEERTSEFGSYTLPGTDTAKSLLAVPSTIREDTVGLIIVENYEKEHAFTDSDVRLLTTLAASMSVALESARLFDETNRLLEETQQRAAELTTVNTVGKALTSELELEALIDLIGEQVRQIFSADITYVALLDQQTYLIEFPYAVGEDLEAMPYGEGLTSKIIDAGEPLLINDEVNKTVDEIGATHTGVDVQSYLGVPIMVGGQAIGVISVQSMNEIRQFNEDDVRLLSTIAANVGAAIRNAQLYRETQQRADEMAALTEIGREISATLELENVLERIATRARDLLSARTATIRLVEEDGSLPTVVAIGKHAEKHRNTTIQMGEGITGNVAKSGLAEIINDPRNDARIVHVPGTPEEEDELEAIIFAPLMISERVIGVMGLWRDRPVAGPFSQEDLNFLQSLARQAANAIENARLFEEVQRQKLYVEALVQNSPVAIMTSDLDNKVVSWNPAAENLFGYRAEEAIGLKIHDLISGGKVGEEIDKNFNRIRDGGRVNTVSQRFRKDGSPVDVELLALPVVMDGKQVGLVAIYHDITELLRARREAEAANEAKSAFLATMSHEIRTPMNGVIGMTSLLLDTNLDAEQRDFTETIRSSGEALLTVINDILDFSKIEAGKMELEEQPFNLRECLESALDLLKFEASDKGVELAYEMEPDVPAVIVGDITRLRQVLINLLNNGLKFTEQGEVVLSVSTKAVPILPLGPYTLHFSIRDTGIGIPPERVDRLFQAFSQVDASTSRKYGGTGLGLAISKRLSELMGGEMWVESVVGEGTTFHFTISAQASPDMRERDDLRGEQPQLSGKRILIVDDNLTNRRILTLQTRAWGMLPRDTSDPHQALKWIRQGDPFDLAILDYHMPGMDGIQLSHAIRDTADFPLILFSSIGARETVMGEDQFAAFLIKPLKQSILLDTLMNLFASEAKKVEPEDEDEKIGFDPELADKLPLRILLVEDNAVNQKLALRLLEQMGYRADLAGNGLEAIQAVGRQKYDVVLMDVQMPEMDGLEASRRICARWPRGERPHIVAMTANAMQGDRERCLAAGMDDYVSKPIRVNELVAALAKARPLRDQDEELAKTRRN